MTFTATSSLVLRFKPRLDYYTNNIEKTFTYTLPLAQMYLAREYQVSGTD